jgi:peptidyl-prolyl cis-trans isomerase SurA
MVRHGVLAVVLICLLAGPAAADEVLADGIAAQVGSDIVLVSEVMEQVAPIEARMRKANMTQVDIAKLRAAGLEKLIETRLIEQVVRRSELFASEAEINQAIDMIARENGITREQLERSVVAQGLTVDEYYAQLKGELERRKVIGAMVASKVSVDESEVRALYHERFDEQPEGGEMVHLRQILVTGGGEAQAKDACAPVRSAAERIAQGESFEKLASEISEVAPAQGGDIGWLHADSLASWMAEVVGPLVDGDVSKPVDLPFGCSLLKLVERRNYQPVSYEEAKEKLHMEIYERQVETEFRAWIEDLREQTYIERKGIFAEAAMLGSESGFADEKPEEEGSLF